MPFTSQTANRVWAQRITARARNRDLLWSLAAFGLPFLVYLRTLAPTVYALDSAELTTGAYTLGIVHAPGSPTYLLLGHLFTWLPVGDVGYRLNLMSASAAALSVLFVFHILVRLTGRRVIALGSAWFVAYSYYLWTAAVAAELYALNACFVTALIWLALKWRAENRAWQIALFAFLFGAGLGNHLSLALLGPGYAWLVLNTPTQSWRRPAVWLTAAACGLLGTLVYLYIPIRFLADPPLNYARAYWQVNLATLDGLAWMISGRMFGPLFFGIPPAGWPAEMSAFLSRLASNYLGLGCLVGGIGLIVEGRRRPVLQIGFVLMLTAFLAFYVPYAAGDKDTMFLPAHVIWGLEIGLGFAALADWTRRRGAEAWAGVVPSLVLLMAAGALVVNFRLADLSGEWRTRQWGENILAAVDTNAMYFGTWADVPILEYLQVVEGRGRGVTAVNLFFTGTSEAEEMADRALRRGIPVFASVEFFEQDRFEIEQIQACRCLNIALKSQGTGRPE